MKIGITGSSGFIGSHLRERLKKEGYDLLLFSRSAGQSILSKEDLEEAVKECDLVIHLASVVGRKAADDNAPETIETNVVGTARVASVCGMLGKPLLFFSSVAVYGYNSGSAMDESYPPDPQEFYSASKLSGEWILRGLGMAGHLRYTIVRPSVVYGPGMSQASFLFRLIRDIARGDSVRIPENDIRSYIFIDDLIDAVAAVLRKGAKNETVNLSSRESVPLEEFAGLVREVTGSSARIEVGAKVTRSQIIDPSRAEQAFGWTARVPLREGIGKTVRWIQSL